MATIRKRPYMAASFVLIVLIVLALLAPVTVGRLLTKCRISNSKAIAKAKQFTAIFEIPFGGSAEILEDNRHGDDNNKGLDLGNIVKEYVACAVRWGTLPDAFKTVTFPGHYVDVDCNTGDIVFLSRAESGNHSMSVTPGELSKNKNSVSPHERQELYLSEREVENILTKLLEKLEMPTDMVFKGIELDEERGLYIANWIRELNGYEFYDDRMVVKLSPRSGEVLVYEKIYDGQECPTEIAITREQAVQSSRKILQSLFHEDEWAVVRKRYEPVYVESKIVQPNVFFGKSVPYSSKKSRLAWVIKFKLDTSKIENLNLEAKTLVDQNAPKSQEVWIDAKTGRYIGGPIIL